MTPAATTRNKTAEAARLFHALSDVTRLDIVRLLRNGEKCVCDLTDALDAAQSRLSFHLKTLKDAGIVDDRREGRWIYYTLNADGIGRLEKILTGLKPSFRILAVKSDCC